MKLAFAILVLLLTPLAKADSVWTYQGNSTSDPDVGIIGPTSFIPTPNPCNCALSGTLILDAFNNPVGWSFTEGGFTLNNTDSILGLSINQLIPGEPLFSRWFIGIIGADFSFLSIYDGSNYEATDSGPGLYVQGNKGSWTDPIGTPEPSTIFLVGLAALGLGITTGSSMFRPVFRSQL
jgi:hypothetical protein